MEIIVSNWVDLIEITEGLDAIGVMYGIVPNKQGFYEYWIVGIDFIMFSIV